jgi:hypothetical protein
VFWGADMRGARFRDVDLTDATISHALLVNVQIDALVERMVINGVDVTDYVNERDAWYPLRAMLRPTTPDEMRATWAELESTWASTITRAQQLPESTVQESVDGEFSFVETLRHLVFAIDKWFTVPVLGEPFHPFGLPNKGSLDFPWPGLDATASPSLAEVLEVRADRAQRIRERLASLSLADFATSVDVLENGPHPLQECLFTVFEEEFWHHRYAVRDLDRLAAR